MVRDWSVDGKRVLVTGGTGSIGRVLVRRILSGELGTPAKVIVFSRDETKQHEMRVDYIQRRATTDEIALRNAQNLLDFKMGDMRDLGDVTQALRGADVVLHAAALKQLPACEYFPEQAIRTNCLGSSNIVRAIHEFDLPVECVVGISTDKACKPVSVMGMTKALQERIFVAANVLAPRTRFVGVRYGNVLASRGSVVPLFLEQIRAGGPVTVTMPGMTRFLLSQNRAVDAVFAALVEARAGEIYVPRVPSATVADLATALIGARPIEVRTTGIRPGEKIHEILISEEEVLHSVLRPSGYYCIKPMLAGLAVDAPAEAPAVSREYSSADGVIDLSETTAMLRREGLIPPETEPAG